MNMRFVISAVSCVVVALCFGGCSSKQSSQTQLRVLIRMMPAQHRYFVETVIPRFEKENNCKINVSSFENEWDIPKILKLDATTQKPEIGLVKVPFELTRDLVQNNYLLPLSDAVDTTLLMQDLAEYHPLACGLGYVDGKSYYIPRKLETRIMFYRKSKVAEAVTKFVQYKNACSSDLKKQNGYGLPAGYELEGDPALWDFYDVFVAGYIWAHEEYNGVKMGRIAHRGARYGGTALDLVDRALQMGSTKEGILKLTTDTVVSVFSWENVLVKNGLYNLGMWQDPYRGANIYNGIKDGKVYLTFLQQIDCFLVHGWQDEQGKDDPGMPSYLPDIDDMGLCVMPKAVSFELDATGKPKIEGNRSISTGGWWWGIPKNCPNVNLAYKLARFITSKDIQAEECTRFGMIPVRKDILNNLEVVFDQGWVGEIFKTSVDQIKLNEMTTVPLVKEYPQVGENLIDAWYKLCVEYDEAKSGKMTSAKMKTMLTSEFLPKQKEILGADFPK